MKKVISILVSLALIFSCCVVAFASSTTLTAGEFAEWVSGALTDSSDFSRVLSKNGIDASAIPTDMTLSTEEIYNYLQMFLDDGCMTASVAKGCVEAFGDSWYGKLDSTQVAEINAKIDAWDAEHNPTEPTTEPTTGGSGDSGDSGSGSGFDLSDLDGVKDILSNVTGNIDLDQFKEGAKSAAGKLIDGIKGLGLPDLSSITGLLGGLGGGSDILGTIMGLLGMGGDDSGDSGNSGNNGGTTPYTPSTNPSGANSNTQVIPKTADTAPVAAVAALAAVAGVAFVLTRKKNED